MNSLWVCNVGVLIHEVFSFSWRCCIIERLYVLQQWILQVCNSRTLSFCLHPNVLWIAWSACECVCECVIHHLPVDVRRRFRITTFGYGRVEIITLLDDLSHLLAQPLVREHRRNVSCMCTESECEENMKTRQTTSARTLRCMFVHATNLIRRMGCVNYFAQPIERSFAKQLRALLIDYFIDYILTTMWIKIRCDIIR